MKFKAFISYRHSENGRRHAIALETALKRYAKSPLARPMKIFRDEKHMKPDNNLSKLVKDGLDNSEYLIFLAEKASANSLWCCEELEFWCSPSTLNRTVNLVIVLIDDDIVLNKTHSINFEQTTALPGLLKNYLAFIPLYVDLRWAKTDTDTDLQHSKYRHAINALAARLRGVNPEDLNDEEIRVFRRNIRVRNGAIAVLLGLLVVAAGATWWAVKQQGIAETNAIEAQKQQKKAEENLAAKIEEETKKERLNFDKYVSSGDIFARSGDFSIALRYYKKADSVLLKFPNDVQLQSKEETFAQKLNYALIQTQPNQ